MTADTPELDAPLEAEAGVHYGYRASLIGGARRFDLTEQGRLLRTNPEQARAMAAEAGVKI